MTIGEKIKYCRKQIGITQDKLAEPTGIHPVSIRKYETNKMQPQPPQLEKIAAALGVSYNALNGSDTAGLRLETVGDLMGVLMVLCNSGILQISGERGEDKLLKDDTVSIHLNPVLSSYLEIGYTSRGKAHTLSLQDALLNIRNLINPLSFSSCLHKLCFHQPTSSQHQKTAILFLPSWAEILFSLLLPAVWVEFPDKSN